MNSTAAESPEATSDKKTSPKELIKFIHSQGMKAGIAIKPGTSVDVLYDIFDNEDRDEVPEVRGSGLSSLAMLTSLLDGARHDSGTRLRWTEIYARHDAKGASSSETVP